MADWEIFALMAAFLSVMIAALLLMISKFFDFRMLEQSAKAELMFAASSVFVAIFLIGLVQYGTDIGKSIASDMYVYTYEKAGYLHYTVTEKGADGNDVQVEKELTPATFSDQKYTLIEISILYMRAVMYCAESIGSKAYVLSMIAHEISSISQDVFMAYPVSGWAWGGIAQAADNLLNTVYFMELVYRLQIYVLRFMDIFALPYLIPIGIVMRAFPPTRGAGAYVIAFAVAIYLVYPMAYLAAVFSSPYPNLCTTLPIPVPSLGENAKAGIVDELRMWYRAFESTIVDFTGKFSDFTNALLVNLCLFPFLAFSIAMTFMQFSNGLFGANVPEVGRGLIKLI